jgi:hypothetical protein
LGYWVESGRKNLNTTTLKTYLDKHPEIKDFTGKINKNFTEITFYKKDKNGFDITIEEDNKELILFTETAYHEHFEYDMFENKEEAFDYVFGLTRDLLSNNMRIREIQKNNMPTKVYLEYNKNNIWEEESSIGILSWTTFNPFAKKKEIIYVNNILPGRELD